MDKELPTPTRNGDVGNFADGVHISVRIVGRGLEWRRALSSCPHPELFKGERWAEVDEGGRMGFLVATQAHAEWRCMSEPWFIGGVRQPPI